MTVPAIQTQPCASYSDHSFKTCVLGSSFGTNYHTHLLPPPILPLQPSPVVLFSITVAMGHLLPSTYTHATFDIPAIHLDASQFYRCCYDNTFLITRYLPPVSYLPTLAFQNAVHFMTTRYFGFTVIPTNT